MKTRAILGSLHYFGTDTDVTVPVSAALVDASERSQRQDKIVVIPSEARDLGFVLRGVENPDSLSRRSGMTKNGLIGG